MGATHFSGAVTSTNGFVGALTGAVTGNTAGTHTGAVAATTVTASTSAAIGTGGTALTLVKRGTVTVDLASVLTLATTECTVTITGAAVGDSVIIQPPAAGLTAGMCICNAVVSATDTVKIRVFNGSAGTIDEASGTWTYCLIRS